MRAMSRFSLRAEELRYWSGATRARVLEAEAFDLWVGADSTAALHASFKLASN
jgi:beta-glucosidase